MSTPRPNWYQFSLKSLFVLITVGAICFALYYVRIGRYQATVAALRDAGATLQFTGPIGTSSIIPERVTAVHVPAGVDAAEIIRIAGKLPDLLRINLVRSNVKDADLAMLASYPVLSSIDLASTEITEKGLAHLHKVATLETVNLGETFITADAIAGLEAATGCRVDAKVLQPLSEEQHAVLRQILVEGGNVTFDQEGALRSVSWEPLDLERLTIISKFPTLQRCWSAMPGTLLLNVTDAWLERFSRIRDLQALEFQGPAVSDEGLSHIADLTKLAYLRMSTSAATGEGVRPWRPMPNLYQLSIDGAELTTLDFIHPASYRSLDSLTLKCPKLTHLPSIDWTSMSRPHSMELECPNLTDDSLASIVPHRFSASFFPA